MSEVKWRTCGACYEQYEGKYGECPKCAKQHAKKSYDIGGSTGHRKGRPTLDVQEGNDDL